MFTINEDNSIYATRGDIVYFVVTAEDDGVAYKFQVGDVLRIKVYGKKDAESVALQKDFPVTEETEKVEIFLTEADTKIGEVISKPKDYWYEVELNPHDNPQTIIGYDEDGAKLFRLFPEGDDIPEFVPDPEDVRVIDEELDMTSSRPVQNQAIARAVVVLDTEVDEAKKSAIELARELAVEKARIDNLVAGGTADNSEVVDIRVGADGVTYPSAGTAVRDQFNKLNSAISKRYMTPNRFNNKAAFTEGYYIKAGAEGPIRENADLGYYKSYDLEAGKTYVVSGEDAHVLVSCSDSTGANVFHKELTAGNTFTIPSTAVETYINAWLHCIDKLQIEEGTEATSYTSFRLVYVLSGIKAGDPIVVDKSGNGLYTTLTEAVQNAADGSVILVMPGVYENEEVKAWGKTLHIVGVSKKDCIIHSDSGDYYAPPMEFCSGTLRNLAIIHQYNASHKPDTKGYAIHVEHDSMIGKNLLIENCYIESQWNFAVGMGMRKGCHVEFNNCDFVGADETHGGLFFHDCNNKNGIGEQNIVVKNCNIYSKGSGATTDLKIQSQEQEGSSVYVEFVNCNVRNITTGKQTITMLNSGASPVDAVEKLTNFHLSYGSFGNNASVLNK